MTYTNYLAKLPASLILNPTEARETLDQYLSGLPGLVSGQLKVICRIPEEATHLARFITTYLRNHCGDISIQTEPSTGAWVEVEIRHDE